MNKPRQELIDLRKKNKFTQIEFAEKCKLTRQYVWMIESGKYRPSIEVMLMIANVLKVNPTKIFKIFTDKK